MGAPLELLLTLLPTSMHLLFLYERFLAEKIYEVVYIIFTIADSYSYIIEIKKILTKEEKLACTYFLKKIWSIWIFYLNFSKTSGEHQIFAE